MGIVCSYACEINFTIKEGEKESYSTGDIVVIEVEVVFTHRMCPVSLKETKFKYEGVKILGATEWKQVTEMKYIRKLKVQLIELKKGEKGKSQIFAIRSCEKDGGYGNIEILRQ